MWPLPSAPTPPACACGAPRVLELQLMSPLCAAVLECATWLDAAGMARHREAMNALGNAEWLTVALFTCEANCCGAACAGKPHGCVAEEWCAVVSEDGVHVAEELVVGQDAA